MDVAETHKELKRGDIIAMAIYIYHFHLQNREEPPPLTINGFKFQYNPHSGEVKQVLHSEGGVTSRLGEKHEGAYIFEIKHALMLAAKIHLLAELKKIPVLKEVININIETGANIDERSINQMLGRLSQVRGVSSLSVVSIFGLASPKSKEHQVVQQVLSQAGVKHIETIAHANTLLKKIEENLPQPASGPTPKKRKDF